MGKSSAMYINNSPFHLVVALSTILLLCSTAVGAQEKQDTIPAWKEKIELSGYIKNMQSINIDDLDHIGMDELIHNRINFKAYLSDQWTFSTGLRNRLFIGSQLKLIPQFDKLLEYDSGWMDLSKVSLNRRGIKIHHMVDRLNFKYVKNNFEVNIGRQRINWGIALAWNPNDLFNSYNFIDFDYEERPGADALRAQYYFSDGMSYLDFAIARNAQNEHTYALKYNFNKANYDFQILTGKYLDDWVIGVGWAGSVSDMGFKGETTYFIPAFNDTDENGQISSTINLDYSFKNALYLNWGFLFNSTGQNDELSGGSGVALSGFNNITAKYLFPSKFSTLLSVSYPINPLWSINFSSLYGFGIDLAYFSPSLSYSIREDLDASLIGQQFLLRQNDQFDLLGNSIYFRLKWSFSAL